MVECEVPRGYPKSKRTHGKNVAACGLGPSCEVTTKNSSAQLFGIVRVEKASSQVWRRKESRRTFSYEK